MNFEIIQEICARNPVQNLSKSDQQLSQDDIGGGLQNSDPKIQCVGHKMLHFLPQFFFKTFFAPINISEVTLEMYAELDVELHVVSSIITRF
jgi:hypothetical protein